MLKGDFALEPFVAEEFCEVVVLVAFLAFDQFFDDLFYPFFLFLGLQKLKLFVFFKEFDMLAVPLDDMPHPIDLVGQTHKNLQHLDLGPN